MGARVNHREHNNTPKGRLWMQIDRGGTAPSRATQKRRATGFAWRMMHTRRKHPLPPMLDRTLNAEPQS